MSHGTLKVNVFVSRRTQSLHRGHVRSLPGEASRWRSQSKPRGTGREGRNRAPRTGRCVAAAGELQDAADQKSAAHRERRSPLSAEEKAAALELLRDPSLLERVLEDFDRCGVVGEETNKRMRYLAAVSRLLEKPLAIVVQSSFLCGQKFADGSGAGLHAGRTAGEYSAMTGQALFYMGAEKSQAQNPGHRGRRGSAARGYALKLLQSEGVLNIARPAKTRRAAST